MRRLLRRYRRHSPEAQGSPDAVVFVPRNVRKEQGSPDLVGFRSREARKEQTVPQRACLQGVAVEIQQAILHQMPDMATLQALISASPIYLMAYQSQCHSVLSSILRRDIHPDVLFDALAIVDALKLPRDDDDYVSHLKAFLEHYKTTRASPDMALQPLEPKTKKALSEFHLSVIDATKDFCDHALSTHPVTGQSLYHFTSLSPHEIRRIHRAFYRYELFTVLFHEEDFDLDEARFASERDSTGSLDTQDKSLLFLALFNVWEVEELACVRDYITRRYAELCKECKSESQKLLEGNPHYHAAPWDFSPEWMPNGQNMLD